MGRMNVRQMWARKLAGGSLPAARAEVVSFQAEAVVLRRPYHGVVLGIDPSLRGTGLALVEFTPDGHLMLRCQTVKVPPAKTVAQALGEIHRAVAAMLEGANVKHVALEQTIYVQNVRTAQAMGAARGAAISAVALAGIEVFEYPPLRVKEAVVGHGRASKEQVARTVMAHLGLARALAFDESDAAAVALCHAFTCR